MTIKDCIIKAATYLGLSEYAEDVQYNRDDLLQTEKFIDMARDVIREICTDYYPLIKTEAVTIAEDGVLLIKTLSEAPLDILSVKKDGISFPFITRYNRFEAAIWGDCTVEYSFTPEIAGISTKLPFPDKIDSRVIAFGIAAEYCIINGLDDAVIWDKRYKDALKKAVRVKGERRVRRRAWK